MNVLDHGPFFHGTKANLRAGDLLTAGFISNYRDGLVMNHLYAEDYVVNVELVKQIAALRPSVAQRIAPSGALAVQMARIDPPQLMLVDMHLGDMTGIELARA